MRNLKTKLLAVVLTIGIVLGIAASPTEAASSSKRPMVQLVQYHQGYYHRGYYGRRYHPHAYYRHRYYHHGHYGRGYYR